MMDAAEYERKRTEYLTANGYLRQLADHSNVKNLYYYQYRLRILKKTIRNFIMPTRKEIEHHLISKLGRDIKHYLLMEDIYEKPGNEDQPDAAIYRLAKISTKLIDNELIPDDYLIGLKSILDEEQLEPLARKCFPRSSKVL